MWQRRILVCESCWVTDSHESFSKKSNRFAVCALLIVQSGNRVYCKAPTSSYLSHARQIQKTFCFFDCSVWINSVCHRVCFLLHICAVEQTMLWDSRHSHNSNNMMHATCLAYVFREGKPTSARFEVLCWQQHVECELKTLKLWGICSRMLSLVASYKVLQTTVFFTLIWVKTNFKSHIFYFQAYVNPVEEKTIYISAAENL